MISSKYIFIVLFLLATISILAQNYTRFPSHLIDTSIINKRGLNEQVEMLETKCNWSNKLGGKVDVFWLKTDRGNFLGYVYEYIFDCDNLRLIYWYNNTDESGKIVDFMIENAEDESDFVVRKKKHLKNRKKYLQFFEEN